MTGPKRNPVLHGSLLEQQSTVAYRASNIAHGLLTVDKDWTHTCHAYAIKARCLVPNVFCKKYLYKRTIHKTPKSKVILLRVAYFMLKTYFESQLLSFFRVAFWNLGQRTRPRNLISIHIFIHDRALWCQRALTALNILLELNWQVTSNIARYMNFAMEKARVTSYRRSVWFGKDGAVSRCGINNRPLHNFDWLKII
jgi:hypothetical protein